MPPDNPIRHVLPLFTIMCVAGALNAPSFAMGVVLLLVGIGCHLASTTTSWSLESDIARIAHHVDGSTQVTVIREDRNYRIVGIVVHSLHAGAVTIEEQQGGTDA